MPSEALDRSETAAMEQNKKKKVRKTVAERGRKPTDYGFPWNS